MSKHGTDKTCNEKTRNDQNTDHTKTRNDQNSQEKILKNFSGLFLNVDF